MMLFRSPIKTFFALATICSLLVSSSEAATSEECLNETIMVQMDTNVASTIQKALNGTLTLTDPSTCTTSGNTLSCSYDFAATSSNLESTCETAGGQFVVHDLTITCDVTVQGVAYVVTGDAKSAPSCIGTSCDPSQYVENYTAYVEEFLNNSTALENCDVSTPSSAPSIRGAKAFLVITGTLFASMFLF
jgi:hypothetical protein